MFRELGIEPIAKIPILTPSTHCDAPHLCDLYDVELTLVAGGVRHPFGAARVIAADGWNPSEPVDALIGRDVLDHCTFQYFGKDQQFTFGF